MFFNDKPLTVAKDPATGFNMGKIKFRTTGGTYDKNGLADASFRVKINIKGNLMKRLYAIRLQNR
jgi:hypothetical protein